MSKSQSTLSKDSTILIVGAGTFGLSTALHLAQDGYTKVTILDRAPVPSPYSAGHDLNKIVRAEYEDPFYTQLALDAIRQWQTPFWSPYYRASGYLVTTSRTAPQNSRDSLQKAFSTVRDNSAFPDGSILPIKSVKDIRHNGQMLQGKMEGWTGYLNKHAGYARAVKAMEHAAKACREAGFKIITGNDGFVAEILYESGSKQCSGVKTASGRIHQASKTVLCLGAHIGTVLPQIAQQITAKSWAVAHLQLTPEEATSMKGCPVVMCRDIGFFFEPDDDTNLLKLCANGGGYTNFVAMSEKMMSIPTPFNDGIPLADEELIKRLISEAIPQFEGRELVNKFICWCGDTAESEYIIDFVPGTENLMVVAGDSGHAFKMLPVAGKWVKKALEDGNQEIKRWRWNDAAASNHDISWRVGSVKDIKDVGRANRQNKI